MKVQKISTNVSPFAGISFVNNEFDKIGMSQLIDSELGSRVKTVGFFFSDIIKNLFNVFYSGGSCAEDIQTHLGKHLKSIPDNHVPSADTILRGIKELAAPNSTFISKQGNSYDFNINTKLNRLNIKSLLLTKELGTDTCYDFDYDNQITRAYSLLKENGIRINRSRMDAGSYAKDIINVVASNSKLFYIRANKCAELFRQITEIEKWETVEINYIIYEVASLPFTQFCEEENYRLVIMREKSGSNQIDMFTEDTCVYRSILTNDWQSTEKEVVEYYNQRGGSEKHFDVMNNDFGWKHLPCSFLNENTAYLIIMAMAKNFYNYFIAKVSMTFENILPTTRLKHFIFRFISVAGKWVYSGRQWVLKLYTDKPYESLVV